MKFKTGDKFTLALKADQTYKLSYDLTIMEGDHISFVFDYISFPLMELELYSFEILEESLTDFVYTINIEPLEKPLSHEHPRIVKAKSSDFVYFLNNFDVKLLESTPPKPECICDLSVLMNVGCRCGCMKFEKKLYSK